MESPVSLELNKRGELYSVTSDGDTVIYDPKSQNLPELTKHIPDCPIDVICGGVRLLDLNSRKGTHAGK